MGLTMSSKEIVTLLRSIDSRLSRLEAAAARQENPSAYVSGQEYASKIAAAMRLGDRKEVKRLARLMNGGKS